MKDKKNLLIVSPSTDVFNLRRGDEVRVHNIAIKLAKKNDIIIVEPEKFLENKSDLSLKTYGFKKYTSPYLTDFDINFILKIFKVLRRENIDIIQIELPQGIIATKFITKLIRQKIPIIYDAHNVEGDRIKHIKKSQLPFYKKIVAPYFIPVLEKISAKCADHIISVSDEDRNRFIEKYNLNEGKISIIPSGVNKINLPTLENKDKVKMRFNINSEIMILFHGTFSYFPNKEAINLIRSYVAPNVMKIKKDILFVIAGLDVPVFEKDNIKSLGFVEDIYSLIHAADMAIVPILHGGGTRLKILDYMGVGLPIVTTKKGVEGINAKNGEHAIIVDDVNDEFINAIKYLIENEEERKRIGTNARRLAEEEYDWEKIGEKLDKLYKNILKEVKC